MSEKGLKVVPAPEAKSAPQAPTDKKSIPEAPAEAKSGLFGRFDRRRLRMLLLVGLPALAVLIGAALYLAGGRYISTDNAYVGAQKVLITPDISGKVAHIAVREGQHVKPGDELFTLDREPFQLALDQANAKLAAAKVDYEKLKTSLSSLNVLVDLGQANVDLKQRDV